jgi:hypothetical protein
MNPVSGIPANVQRTVARKRQLHRLADVCINLDVEPGGHGRQANCRRPGLNLPRDRLTIAGDSIMSLAAATVANQQARAQEPAHVAKNLFHHRPLPWKNRVRIVLTTDRY